jgi:hypothetical protein
MPAKGFKHNAGDVIDWLNYDNPDWQKRGVLVQATDKEGVTKARDQDIVSNSRGDE